MASDHETTPPSSPTAAGELLLEEAESLIWQLLDGQLTEATCQQLEQMIFEHEAVRRRYLECVQLHTDLHEVVGKRQMPPAPALPAETKSPVLGSLGDTQSSDLSGTDSRPLPG